MKLAIEVDGFDPGDENREMELREVFSLIEKSAPSTEILNDAWDNNGSRRDYIVHVYSQEASNAINIIQQQFSELNYDVSINEEFV